MRFHPQVPLQSPFLLNIANRERHSLRLPPPVGPRAFGDLEKSHYLCRRVNQQDTEIQAKAGRDDREVRLLPSLRELARCGWQDPQAHGRELRSSTSRRRG